MNHGNGLLAFAILLFFLKQTYLDYSISTYNHQNKFEKD